MMKITNEDAYNEAIEEFRRLFNTKPGSPDHERFLEVSHAIEEWEASFDTTGSLAKKKSGRNLLQSVGIRVIGSFF